MPEIDQGRALYPASGGWSLEFARETQADARHASGMRTFTRLFHGLVLGWTGLAMGAQPESLRPWTEYKTIMWVAAAPIVMRKRCRSFFERLREMGINTAMVHGDGSLRPLLTNRFPYYVENMVNRGLCLKFNSTVKDWDKFITEWTKTGRSEAALVRDYSLDDPQWLAGAKKEMEALVRKNMSHQPLAYDIRDELSTTISANPFDYDFSPATLAAFREWLRTQYRDLAALNAEWQTGFASWEAVKPFTTDEIKNRMASGDAIPRGKPDWQALQKLKFNPATAGRDATRWNFGPWADFRTYMDLSLARTLNTLREAAHALDPRTPVGIEGTQMPAAWGGYDLWRLSQVLDWVEPYDIGNAREIFGSFMSGKPILTTVFEKETKQASRRLWHLLLEGDRGCIIWWSEDCIDWKSADYALTAKGKALAPVLREMTSPLARLFLQAKREVDPIALVYSQPGIQVNWLLESTVDGSTWVRRFSSFEAEHNRAARKRNGWLKLFQDLGYSPHFIPASDLTAGAELSPRVLVLSETWGLSSNELKGLNAFLHTPGSSATNVAFADAPPGAFNEHGKLRGESPYTAYFASRTNVIVGRNVPGLVVEPAARDIAAFARGRLSGEANDWYAWAGSLVTLPRLVTVPPETHTRVHRYQSGTTRLLAFERNLNYQMSEELKQAGGNEPLETPVEITARLAAAGHVYNLRSGHYLGQTNQITFRLDPWQPSLFAIRAQRMEGTNVVERLLGEGGN